MSPCVAVMPSIEVSCSKLVATSRQRYAFG